MSLAIIGAGFGRTGTLSLKLALEHLGLGPCYHMTEVLQHPRFVEHWVRATEGARVDWDVVFQGYAAAVDWPACDYWRELAAYYPEARVILTVRDPEAWFVSTQSTIFGAANSALIDDSGIGQIVRAIAARHFGGVLNDRTRLIDAYKRHNANVRDAIAPSRLLVFQASDGWDPLCRFLDRPVPKTPFPSVNTTDDFRVRAAGRTAHGEGR
jgi:hypothetical protein